MLKIEDLLDKSPYELGKMLLNDKIFEQPEDLQIILSLEPILDIKDEYLNTPLHLAARSGDVDACKSLIVMVAQVDVQNRYGRAPLHLAANKGHLDVCKTLIDADADVNIQDFLSWTPLYYAVVGSHLEICKILIEHGARLDIEDDENETPWDLASSTVRDQIPQLNPNKKNSNA